MEGLTSNYESGLFTESYGELLRACNKGGDMKTCFLFFRKCF